MCVGEKRKLKVRDGDSSFVDPPSVVSDIYVLLSDSFASRYV